MQDEQYQTNDKHQVNERGGHVKCEKAEQPQNNQDYSNCS